MSMVILPGVHASRRGRTLLLATVLTLAFTVVGCSTELEKDLRSSNRLLDDSDQFSHVWLATDNDKPWSNRTDIHAFTANLEPDADATVTGQALADSADASGYVPDVMVDDSTWLVGVQDTYQWQTTAQLAATEWAGLIELARATHASEVDVWLYDDVYDRGERPTDTHLTLRTAASTYAEGLQDFEALAETPVPIGVDNLCIQLDAGTDAEPLEVPSEWGSGKPRWPRYPAVHVSGPVGTEILKAREILEAAEQRFDSISEFFFVYWGDLPIVEVTFGGPETASHFGDEGLPDEAMDDAARFTDEVEAILGEETDTAVLAMSPNDTERSVYHREHPELDRPASNTYGCLP